MARINTSLAQAAIDEAIVVDRVRRDPAVVKAWGEAVTDLRTAVGSAGRAISETVNSYSRNKFGHGGAPAPARA